MGYYSLVILVVDITGDIYQCYNNHLPAPKRIYSIFTINGRFQVNIKTPIKDQLC
jgi:hypothetical protein